MEKIVDGIMNNQVVLVRGGNLNRLIVECGKLQRIPDVILDETLDAHRVSNLLSVEKHTENPSVYIFMRCDDWMSRISTMIRNRKAYIAVVIVTEGGYTTATPLIESLADRYVVDYLW